MTEEKASSSSALPALDRRSAQATARGLGWFSLALGAAQLLAPKAVARATGLRGAKLLLRLYGIREIAAGVGLLAGADPKPWVWARVAGDALDAATLAAQLNPGNRNAARTAVALAAVAGVAALDMACAQGLDRPEPETPDYSGRAGLPQPADEMRGAALDDFVTPRDMQTPQALAPYPGQ